MDSKKIYLPDFVIANLYTDQLVVTTDAKNTDTSKSDSKKTLPLTANNLNQELIQANPSPAIKTVERSTEKKEPSKTVTPISTSIETDKQWFLGNNQKNITILIRETGVAFINDKHLQLLTNILSACKLNLGDISLVNFSNNAITIQEIKEKLQSKIILVFDINANELQLPFVIPHYQIQQHNNCTFLFSASLNKMDSDTQESKIEKSKLWGSLKTIFKL